MRPLALVSTVSAVILAASAGGCAADEATGAQAGAEIVIGASLELSGPTASIGSTYKKALELKAQQLNDSGTLGDRKIKLVIRDNRTDNNTAVAAVNDLIKNERVAALITGGCSACVVSAMPAITENHMPTIALASASAITTPVTERRYVFKIAPNPAQDATVIATHVAAASIKKIGLIAVNNVYGQDGETSIRQESAKLGVDVVAAEQFAQTDTTMTVQVGKVIAAKPDAVVIWAVMPAAGTIVRELHDAGFQGAVYLDAGAGAELFVKGAGDTAEGTNMAFPRVLATDEIDASTAAGAVQKQWVTAYEQAHGTYSGFASFAADALQVIADAASRDTDSERIRDAIETAALDGASGPVRFSATEHSGLQPQALGVLTVRQGEWHLAR
ncbi:ABC transporter substrate-binding protein [Actinoplanes rectilineatus]|uniref:ABC transporter substrate-binding protein n=1 Tax=Actinoplanes rectilineatus TaxID=113571 RepID=UPI0005F27AEA|nr:ABC transporter substrate-binding protein [Actinoplanes rectilineatus]